MNQSEEALQRTEKEIIAEKAATLGRAGERLEAALGLGAERRQAFESATDPAARAWALAGYRQARSRALERATPSSSSARPSGCAIIG